MENKPSLIAVIIILTLIASTSLLFVLVVLIRKQKKLMRDQQNKVSDEFNTNGQIIKSSDSDSNDNTSHEF